MSPRRRASWLALWLLLASSLSVSLASAQPRSVPTQLYLIAIGVNQPARTEGGEPQALQYADDDAAAVYDFIASAAAKAHLLTLLDRETQTLYPSLVPIARSPTLAALNRAVADVARRIERDRALGKASSVIVFFSGHGSLEYPDGPALLLSDTGLTKTRLYESVLEKLPADSVHLLVDACHAEAVVRPRDSHAQVTPVSAAAANSFLVRSTLASFPHVGAIVASSNDRDTHEWSFIGHGVFTYELLSALRGAADVNRDRLLEYSEVYAFMASANRGIDHPEMRLSVVSKPPLRDRRTPLLNLAQVGAQHNSWLTSVPHRAGILHIGDARGRQLSTVHTAPDFDADVMLPSGGTIYVRNETQEAHFIAKGGERVSFASLRFVKRGTRTRGFSDQALRHGLFASAYGRGYYLGFIDQDVDFVPVTFEKEADAAPPVQSSPHEPTSSRAVTFGLGVAPVVAQDLGIGRGLQLGLRPRGTTGLSVSVAGWYAADGEIAERNGEASAGLLWPTNSGRVQGWLGAELGGGFIQQTDAQAHSRTSPTAVLSPTGAISVELGSGFVTWTEARFSGRLYREEGRTTTHAGPSFWLGAGLEL